MKDFIKQDYKEFNASDFALDRSFNDWVKNKDREAEKFWVDWVKDNPHKREEVELARSLVLALQFSGKEATVSHVNAEWKRLQKYSLHNREHTWKKTNASVFSLRTTLSVAAVVLVIATFSFVIRGVVFQDLTFKSEPLTLIKETPKGQKLSIVLPDGTEIKLNSGSRIQYPSNFTGSYREVVLEGEAFFDVVHHPEMPFKVRVGDVTVEVLGTSFNVEAYPENAEVRIALVTGKVKVNTLRDTVINQEFFLNPSEMIGIDKKNFSHRIQQFDPQQIVGWKDGYLFFKKVDFEETIVKLERWYGVKFDITSSAKIDPDWRFNGKFQNKSLEYILRTFSYPDLFKYRIQEQKIVIY